MATFPGGEWEHGVVEGPTLRRPWRGWISTVASGSALAVALTLMSMADVGRPSARPERVVSTVGPGPTVDHHGSGNAIPPTGEPTAKPAQAPAAGPQPPTSVTTPQVQVQLAVSVAPEPGLTVGGNVEQLGTNPTPPTSPARPGTSRQSDVPRRPRRPKVPHRNPRPPDVSASSESSRCRSDDDHRDWRRDHDDESDDARHEHEFEGERGERG